MRIRHWVAFAALVATAASPARAEEPGLIVHWKLDAGAGMTATDSSGSGNDGTLGKMAGTEWTTGKADGALAFDGVDDFVEADPADWTASAYTVALWVKAASLGPKRYSGVFNNNSPSQDFQIDTNGATPVKYRWLGSSELSFGFVSTEWVHLAVTWDGATLQLYYDGAPTTSAAKAPGSAGEVFGVYAIGRNRRNKVFFKGLIDDVRVYSRALPAVEIIELHQMNRRPTVAIDSPVDGRAYASGGTVSLAATADDSDGSVTQVEFKANGVSLGIDTTIDDGWSWSGWTPADGQYTLTAEATDNDGATNVSTAQASITGGSVVNVAKATNAVEPATPGVFTVTRLGDATEAVTVNYSVSGTAAPGSDYGKLSGTVEFAATQTTAMITVTPTDNGVEDLDESVDVTVTTGTGYVPGNSAMATLTIMRPVFITGASAVSSTVIEIGFSKALDRTAAVASYVLDKGVTVSSAVLGPDGRTVTLTTTQLAAETVYTLSVSGVIALDGCLMSARSTVEVGPTGTGFYGVYYIGQRFNRVVCKRSDDVIDFSWGRAAPVPKMPGDWFSCMWLGRIVPRYSEEYKFTTYTDDGVRLWVDGKLIVDRWDIQAKTSVSAPIPLVAGRAYDVVMMQVERRGDAGARLSWSSASQPLEIIPRERVWSDQIDSVAPSAPGDLKASADGLSVTLNWSASIDDYGVAGYEVFRDGAKLGVTCGTSFVEDGLKCARTYAYEVKAFDFATNVSDVASVKITTDDWRLIGTGNGLAAAYLGGGNLRAAATTRIDPVIDFDWGTKSPAPGIDADKFSVVWTGKVQPHVTESHTFLTRSAGGVKLWVGGRLLVDDWNCHDDRHRSATITLVAGEKYPIRLEYCENGGKAVARLLWESASIKRVVIPLTQLYPEATKPLAAMTSFAVTAPISITSPLESATSPVWVEGNVSEAAETVSVSVDDAAAFEAVRESPSRWYADSPDAGPLGIPLTQAAPSASVTIQSKNGAGAVIGTVTQTVTWTATDLTGKTAGADSITIRRGDSLLLTATGVGKTLTINIANHGTSDSTGAPGDTFAVCYGASGVFNTVAKIDGSDIGSLSVTVVDVALAPPVGVRMGHKRLKTLRVSPAGVLGLVPRMVFVPSVLAALDVAVDSVAEDSVTLALNAHATGTASVQARIGGPTGPVVRDLETHTFSLKYLTPRAAPTFTINDGDILTGNALRMKPLYPGHRIRLFILSGGARFESTGTGERFVDTGDFDDNGEYLYYVVTPGVIRHDMEVADEE